MKQKLTMVTTFSGVGMQERGFINSDLFDLEILATSDIDKEAILSYAAIHCGLTDAMVKNYKNYPSKEDMVSELVEKNIGYDFLKQKAYDWTKISKKKNMTLEKYWLALKLANNLGDISKVKRLPKCNLLTFSFPCQSISIAGRQEGIKKGETRSGLIYEIVRLIEVAKEYNELPQYLLLENVAALVSKKFINDFNNLNDFFDSIGYNVYWTLMNGKNCGVPQNRPRTFAVYIRKDIDNKTFEFPKPFDSGIRLKDILEEDVDSKYYLSQEIQNRFQFTDETFSKNIVGTTKPEYRTIGQRDNVYQENGIMGALVATDYKQPKQIITDNTIDVVGKLDIRGHDAIKRVYNPDNLSPALTTMQGGHRQPKVIKEVSNANKMLNMLIETNDIPEGKSGADYCINEPQLRDVSNCITARYDSGVSNYKQTGCTVVENDRKNYYIRKLTPTECYLLMGLTKEDCLNARKMGVSDSSLYKQAGNGIITNCIELIAEHLFKAQYDNTYICTDENFTNPQMD